MLVVSCVLDGEAHYSNMSRMSEYSPINAVFAAFELTDPTRFWRSATRSSCVRTVEGGGDGGAEPAAFRDIERVHRIDRSEATIMLPAANSRGLGAEMTILVMDAPWRRVGINIVDGYKVVEVGVVM